MEGGAELEQDFAELPVVTEEKDGDKAKKESVCEVCGAAFETRRGLSSHARSHLRQMGVCVSESSGAPIALLYQLITERDGKLAFSLGPSATLPGAPCHTEPKTGRKGPTKPKPKPGSVTKLKIKIGELVRRHKPPSSLVKTRPPALTTPPPSSLSPPPTSPPVLLPVSPLAPPPDSPVLPKPHLTPQEPDFLTKAGVHRCELCGACYETRKGLASHARAHLRHLGVDLDTSCSSIKVLHNLLQREAEPVDQDAKDVLPVPKTPPPSKKKTSQHGSAHKDASCEYCGEKFRTTQSLASHARSHLRHLGVTDWAGSPGAMLRELMASRGCTSLPKPTPPTLAPILPPSATPTQAPPLSPPAPGPAPVRVPKARKGSRLAVPRPKPENGAAETPKNKPATSANQSLKPSEANLISANQIATAVLQEEVTVSESVQCDYCSDLFDSRKALSCHARAHLRQLGVKWVQYASPIDTLQELMIREGRGQGSDYSAGVKSFAPSPIDFLREKMEALDGASPATASDATCELCGFDFENRKALASHARAHLRQLGEQWSSSQSPIEVLNQWMSREPQKVAQLHLRYQQGALPQIRRRRGSTPVFSSDPDSAHSAMSRPSAGRESKSTQRKLSSYRPAPYTASVSAHSVRGFERRLPKLVPHSAARAEPLKRVGNAPSLVPPPPETSLVKLVGKIYSLRCRFCEQVFHGPLSVQEDWLIHLRRHILNPSPAPSLPSGDTPQLIGQVV